MAIPAQGMTVTWGGASLLEVREVNIDQDRGLPLQRDGTWTLNLGTVKIVGFSTVNIPETDYSKRRRLIVTMPASSTPGSARKVTFFDSDCLYVDRTISATANDVVRFDWVFRVMDSKAAPA